MGQREDDGISDSSDEGEEEGEEEEEEEQVFQAAPLSQYELQRQRNIANNQQMLAALGLAGGAAAAAAARSSGPVTPSAPRGGVRQRADSGSSSSAGSKRPKREVSRDEHGRDDEGGPSPGQPSHAPLDDEQRALAAALFRGLRGEGVGKSAAVPAPSQLITMPMLARTVAELQMGLSDSDVHDMIASFDARGTNALNFDDFLRIVCRIGPSVLNGPG